jgi:outer membrane protein assembly factor BamE (lipoprotein component of BamABCDE complex)
VAISRDQLTRDRRPFHTPLMAFRSIRRQSANYQGTHNVPALVAPTIRSRRSGAAVIFGLCLTTAACSWILPPPQARGNKVEADQLRELVPGTSTKADVTALIGTPTQKATFDENSWLYISELTRTRVGRTPGILDQGVVILTFDDRGILTGIKNVTKDDAVPVTVATQTTPSPGTEATFMQQLLGNIGKFNPTGGPGFGAGGGAPSSGTGGL